MRLRSAIAALVLLVGGFGGSILRGPSSQPLDVRARRRATQLHPLHPHHPAGP